MEARILQRLQQPAQARARFAGAICSPAPRSPQPGGAALSAGPQLQCSSSAPCCSPSTACEQSGPPSAKSPPRTISLQLPCRSRLPLGAQPLRRFTAHRRRPAPELPTQRHVSHRMGGSSASFAPSHPAPVHASHRPGARTRTSGANGRPKTVGLAQPETQEGWKPGSRRLQQVLCPATCSAAACG